MDPVSAALPQNLRKIFDATLEEDVLCWSNDLYPEMDITVHEFGHSLHWLGFNQLWPDFQALNPESHILEILMSHLDEYFAQGLMSYFDVQWPYDTEAPTNRDQLFQMDPEFATFIDRWMYQNNWRGGCP